MRSQSTKKKYILENILSNDKSVNRPGQWRTIITTSINQQSNSITKRDVKLKSKTSTKMLTNIS